MNKTMSGLAFACLGTIARALDPGSVTNAANSLLESALGAEHACYEFVKGAVEYNGWTQDESTEILMLAERTLRGSTNSFDVYRRNNAISMMGDFAATNALPVLAGIFQAETEWTKSLAGRAYLHVVVRNVSDADSSLVAPLAEEIGKSPVHSLSFAWSMYRGIADDLEYGGPSSRVHRNLLRFLLDQTAAERGEFAMLDEILCREVPKWRASPQRAENAAKMIREHPDDARLVAFFESVRTNALESARAIRFPQNGNSADQSATNRTARMSAMAENDDPWADLLDDLPEKKPWTPPPGCEPRF